MHALVGGDARIPGDVRRRPADFDAWVVRRLLNPASAMFREGSLLLREEPTIADPTSYAAVLATLASGRVRRNKIAGALCRPASALAHLLNGWRKSVSSSGSTTRCATGAASTGWATRRCACTS
jgi:hypothetical protein